ncbi:MAG TPA: hypothetical protein VG101_15505 [Puia sp.]|nr:hypothetical protein [Puia sp.]
MMFGFSKRDKKTACPIPEERRQWLEQAFDWLVGTFDEGSIRERRVLTPHHSDFPIRYDGDHQTGRDTTRIIALQMEIDPEEIELLFYEEGIREISTGDLGHSVFTTGEKKGDGIQSASGRYLGRQDDGKFHIALEQRKLLEPEYMVATLAHELSHIKLLGEKRLLENDEQLTDVNTVIFGLGIFGANAAFTTHQDFRSHGWRKSGYLTQMDWGYVLALFARLRGENDPAWAKYLCKNVKSDFAKSYRYLAL